MRVQYTLYYVWTGEHIILVDIHAIGGFGSSRDDYFEKGTKDYRYYEKEYYSYVSRYMAQRFAIFFGEHQPVTFKRCDDI